MVKTIKTLKRFSLKYGRDTGGHIAVITAMVGLPLVILAGGGIDMNRAVSKKANISAALDVAALASVIPDNLTIAERTVFAQTAFDNNYLGDVPVTLQIDATRDRVDITGTAQVPTLFGGVVGVDALSVSDSTAAVLTKSDVVCVLALDPTGERAIEFKDQAVFNAPSCSVQVNSTNNLAIVSDIVTPPVAKSFCVGGISRGVFSPFIKHACSPIADPYANLLPPEDGPCIDVKKLKGNNDTAQYVDTYVNYGANGAYIAGSVAIDNSDTIGNGTVLEPGTYCKGLKIEGINITFLPGTYVIKGKLEFKKYAGAVGNDVTIVLQGKKAQLKIEGDSQVYLKAPSTGPYAGLVFYQVPESADGGKKKKGGKKSDLPFGESKIKSGGGLSIIGTAYFPTQKLIITSDSPVASYSPATSLIAYRFEFGGKSNTQIHVDHEAGGLPPLLPRSDEGARLVK